MNRTSRYTLLAALCLCCALALPAQSRLENVIDKIAHDPSMAHASFGVCVIDVSSGKVLAKHEAERSIVPASSLKVLTTATALGILGPGYRFKTELQHDGTLGTDQQLDGNLYLKGYGDPTLGSDEMPGAAGFEAVMEQLRMAVQQRGIRRISGHVIGDATWFDSAETAATWQWVDMGNYYGAGVWALNLRDNLYHLHLRQTAKQGLTPTVQKVVPEVPGLSFVNELRSAAPGSGDNAYIYGSPYTYERYLRGTIPAGSGNFVIKGALPDPPLWSAQRLAADLRMVGILADKGATVQAHAASPSPARQVLHTIYSPPLRAIVEQTNMRSVNLYAEALLKAIGQAKGKEGSAEAGLEAMEAYWKARGLKWAGVQLADGSGLSARNVVTPMFMASLMRNIALDKALFEPIYESLPVAGESGGMSGLLKGTPAKGKVRAKTGTLARVRSFTGYATNSAGKLLAFCIIVNNFEGSGGDIRAKLAGIMQVMCE